MKVVLCIIIIALIIDMVLTLIDMKIGHKINDLTLECLEHQFVIPSRLDSHDIIIKKISDEFVNISSDLEKLKGKKNVKNTKNAKDNN